MRRQFRGGVHALDRGNEVACFRHIDAADKALRIAINHRKPCGLDLNHQPVTLEEHVVVIAKRNGEVRRLICDQRLRMRVALVVAAAPNFHRDRQQLTVERLGILARSGAFLGLPSVLNLVFGEDVDQLHHKVAVGAGGRCKKLSGQRPGDHQITFE